MSDCAFSSLSEVLFQRCFTLRHPVPRISQTKRRLPNTGASLGLGLWRCLLHRAQARGEDLKRHRLEAEQSREKRPRGDLSYTATHATLSIPYGQESFAPPCSDAMAPNSAKTAAPSDNLCMYKSVRLRHWVVSESGTFQLSRLHRPLLKGETLLGVMKRPKAEEPRADS